VIFVIFKNLSEMDLNELELADLTVETATPILTKFAPSWDISKVQMKQFSDGEFDAVFYYFWVKFFLSRIGLI